MWQKFIDICNEADGGEVFFGKVITGVTLFVFTVIGAVIHDMGWTDGLLAVLAVVLYLGGCLIAFSIGLYKRWKHRYDP